MAGRAIHLLLIEDNPLDAHVVQSYLSGLDDLQIKVAHATSLTTGLALLAKSPFSLILLDLGLPESRGLDTFLRLHSAYPEVPIVVLTGLEGTELAIQTVRAGAEDYLAKSWLEPNLLVRTIRFAMERAHRRRADEKLRQSEIRYRTLFQQSPDGVLLIDPQTGLPVEFNDAAHRQLGYTREEFARLRISDYEILELPEETQSHIAAILREGCGSFDTRHRTKNGEIRDVSVTVQAITLSGRKLLHVIYRDTTERNQAETGRREMEERFKAFVSKSAYGYTELDRSGEVLFVNRQLCEMLGYASEEMLGRHFTEFVAEDDIETSLFDFEESPLGQPRKGPRRCAVRTKSGAVLSLGINSTWLSEQGQPVRFLCLLLDVTEHRQAQEALRESEAKLRGLFENLADLVLVVDRAGVIRFANRASLAASVQEPIGTSWFNYIAPDHQKRCREALGQSLADENAQTVEAVDIDGRWWQCRIAPMRDVKNGGVAMIICTDVTEQRKVELALGEREQRYSKLLAAVTNYTYSVEMDNGFPVSTDHSWGCLSVTGYTPDDYKFDPYLWIKMVAPDDRDAVRNYAAQILAGQAVPPIEHRIVRRDGAVRWLRSTIVPHHNGNQLIRYDGLVEDITERRLVEQALLSNEVHLLAAGQVQERLLPLASPVVPGFDIGGAVYPAKYTAGDFFDYLTMSNGNVGFVISDVTGHGFGPSLLMATTSTLLRSLTETRTDLGEIMAKVNRFLANETDEDQFVTLLLVCLDPHTRSIVYSSAGHPTGYVIDASGAVKAELRSTGMPLAILPDAEFPVAGPVPLDPGDIVFLMTDGLLDAFNPNGTAYGAEQALEIVRANRTKTANEIIDSLHRDICAFSHREKPADDVTLVVIKAEAC